MTRQGKQKKRRSTYRTLADAIGHSRKEPRDFGPAIRSPLDVYELLKPEIEMLEQEIFYSILLDVKKRVIKSVVISVGSAHGVDVHPREVFREAVRLCADTIVLAHNHPSGDANPSQADLNITRRICAAGKIIDIRVIDHIVIGLENFISICEMGIIDF